MPVTVNLPDPNNKKPTPSQSKSDPKSPSKSASGEPLSQTKRLQIALLSVVIVLALGIIGWSQGWFHRDPPPPPPPTNAQANGRDYGVPEGSSANRDDADTNQAGNPGDNQGGAASSNSENKRKMHDTN
ncbi:MAG TPA: hypothetical protein VKU00_13010 [Chthonomonadaceae bacterium]|nr:hypothetical protein [Chthonomonadaceae bacterium]